MNILIIEDDPEALQSFHGPLQSEGFQVYVLNGSNAGLDLIADANPDVILLDLQLGRRGLDLIRDVRANPLTTSLPIIALGNSYDRKSTEEAWKLGINNCIYRSVCTPRALIAAIGKVSRPERTAFEAPPPPPSPGVPSEASSSSGLRMRVEPPPVATPPPSPTITDGLAAQATVRETFLKKTLEITALFRTVLQSLAKAETVEDRLGRILQLRKMVGTLAANSGMAELPNFANMASALDALLKDLYDKPEYVNPSIMRTLAATIDFLTTLAQHPDAAGADSVASANILSVDDEPMSRAAVTQALERAGLKAISLDDPEFALAILEGNTFDLIVLDIDMPVLTGLELCKQLRLMPSNQKTPVIFVTALTDFGNRAKSTLVGGNDLIAKPFLFMELAIKALTYIQKAKIPK